MALAPADAATLAVKLAILLDPAQPPVLQGLSPALAVASGVLEVDTTEDLSPGEGSVDLARPPAISAVAPTILHEIVS